jgi:glycosyltransferase involved in cell wall biosynthesis
MCRPMKIVYIIDKIAGNLGGTENQLTKLINGLPAEKCEKKLICFSDSTCFQANRAEFHCESTVIPINKVNKLTTYVNFVKLVGHLRAYKPDIVHTFFPVGNSVGVIASKLAGMSNVVSSRRDYGEWMSPRYLLATRFADRFVKKIVANSRQVEELTKQKEKVNGKKLRVIYNGINSDSFKNLKKNQDLKRQLSIPESNKVVGIVANFRPMKHHHIFIKAAKEILSKRNDVSFILVGAGSDPGSTKEDNEKLARSLDISEHVRFVGPQKQIAPYLSIMDIGVNCSAGEGLSNAIMEYMAAGVPCIVSYAGGNPDLITNNVEGFTFELDNYLALADLTLRLLNDDATRKRFIDNAARKIEETMSTSAMLSNYESLYREIVGLQ